MFIQTEPTPNPNALKFLPGRDVAPEPREFRSVDEAAASPLAEALFELEGVSGVFFGADYISITREPHGPGWPSLKPAALTAIMDHFMSGAPLLRDSGEGPAATGDDSELVLAIKALLASPLRP